jgi:hypothetical protein
LPRATRFAIVATLALLLVLALFWIGRAVPAQTDRQPRLGGVEERVPAPAAPGRRDKR